MDQTAAHLKAEPEDPEDEEDYDDCPKHDVFLNIVRIATFTLTPPTTPSRSSA